MKNNIFTPAGELIKNIEDFNSCKIPKDAVKTGLMDLDKLLSGFNKGELVCIAGRPAMGKTSLAMRTVWYLCLRKAGTCLYFTLAEPGSSLIQRLLVMDSKVSFSDLKTLDLDDEDTGESLKQARLESLFESSREIGKSQFYINESADSVWKIKNACRKFHKTGKIDAVIVDYLQLIRCDHEEDENHILKKLKKLAVELDCPVFVLSQLRNTPDNRTDHRPVLSDLVVTGTEHYYDKILFIYRESYYNPEYNGFYSEIIVPVNRSGNTGTVPVTFIYVLTMFEDYVGEFNDLE